jgi:hypothetical protein
MSSGVKHEAPQFLDLLDSFSFTLLALLGLWGWRMCIAAPPFDGHLSQRRYVRLPGTTAKLFAVDDLDRSLSDHDRLTMAETILAWADFDTGVSRLILLVFGLQDDAGSILIGNMDLKTKVEKIKILNAHRGLKEEAAKFARLATAIKNLSECRNTVAHRKCVGKMTSEPTRLVFLSAKHVKNVLGQFEVVCVDHSELEASAKFARKASEIVHRMVAAIEESS